MSDWPTNFPTQCPPEDAVESSEVFYRLVDSDPVSEQDFWSYRQLLDAGLERPRRSDPDPCLAVGVSIFDSPENAARVRGAFGALRSKRIAAGDLDGSGVVKQTGRRGHHTWWRPADDTAWQGFAVVT